MTTSVKILLALLVIVALFLIGHGIAILGADHLRTTGLLSIAGGIMAILLGIIAYKLFKMHE